jgi:hypothetical protein
MPGASYELDAGLRETNAMNNLTFSTPTRNRNVGLFDSPTVVGLEVKLARNIDSEQPCHDNVAVIHPGKAQHVGELRCAACGAHRGWLSQSTRDFILETVRRFGAPVEPITVRQQEMTMSDFDDTNRGALFRNDDKTEEKHPDYRGSLNVGGRDFWLSAWLKVSKKGTKYMSLAIKPKNADTAQPKKSIGKDLADAVPF